jgi:hypothetical protein
MANGTQDSIILEKLDCAVIATPLTEGRVKPYHLHNDLEGTK